MLNKQKSDERLQRALGGCVDRNLTYRVCRGLRIEGVVNRRKHGRAVKISEEGKIRKRKKKIFCLHFYRACHVRGFSGRSVTRLRCPEDGLDWLIRMAGVGDTKLSAGVVMAGNFGWAAGAVGSRKIIFAIFFLLLGICSGFFFTVSSCCFCGTFTQALSRGTNLTGSGASEETEG